MGAGDAEDGEATDTVERGQVARIGASLRNAPAIIAGVHSVSMVAAKKRKDEFAEAMERYAVDSW
jgi:hypothetical protein